MRTFIQALSLALFSLLFFVFANYKLPEWLPADIYLRLDPLLGLSAVLSGREIIGRALWSLLLVGATLIVGRFFCAYVCPMGAAIDFLDPLFWRKKTRSGLKKDLGWRKVKFFLLILFLSSSLAGLTLAYLLDPSALPYPLLHLLPLPPGDYLDKPLFGLAAPDLSSPGVDGSLLPALYPAGLLHGPHHLLVFFRGHRLKPDYAPFLVPVPLSPRERF